MPIFAGSRYEGLSYTIIDDGEQKKFLHLRLSAIYSSTRQHELKPSEDLDLLSFYYHGQSRLWWRFAEANNLFWPFDLPQGTRLDIPG